MLPVATQGLIFLNTVLYGLRGQEGIFSDVVMYNFLFTLVSWAKNYIKIV